MLFVFPSFYPQGGMRDFKGDFDTLEEAQAKGMELTDPWGQLHIYDSVEGKIV